MQIVTIYEGEDVCQQCLGWKRVANSDDQESWKYWAELPAQSAIAVQMGLVKPVECPRCHGSGVEPSGGLTKRVTDGALCLECDSEILPSQYCMMGHWCGEPPRR